MKTKRHDKAIAILPRVDNLPCSQNIGHDGRDGTPHNPLLPERLKKEQIKLNIENRLFLIRLYNCYNVSHKISFCIATIAS